MRKDHHSVRTIEIALRLSVLFCLTFAPAAPCMFGADKVWINNGPEGGSIYALAIDTTAPQTVYAGAQDEGAFKSTDGGGHWSAINTGLTSTEIHAFAIDPTTQTIYAGTYGNGVFKLFSKPDIDFNNDGNPDILWRN
jgi:hypothetical protein